MTDENENQNVKLEALIEAVDERGPERSPTKKMKLGLVPDYELSEKITKQLDYYFSDVNVIKDKYLQEKFKENDGWVKLSDLLTFVRMKDLTTSAQRVVQALRDCKSLVVDIDQEKLQVRRTKPMPDPAEFQKQLDLRTVHISGFPTEYEFDQLRRYCTQFGEVESVAMRRRFKTKFFKGCIHVVFKEEADAKKVLATEILKCKDRELRKESMAEYYRRKAEMAEKRQQKMRARKNVGSGGNNDKDGKGEDKKEVKLEDKKDVKSEDKRDGEDEEDVKEDKGVKVERVEA